MPLSTAHVATDHPSRHIEQVVAQADPAIGRLGGDGRATVTFEHGTCVLAPAGARLELVVTAQDEDAVRGIQEAVTRLLAESQGGQDLRVGWTPVTQGESVQITDPVVSDYLLTHCTPADDLLDELVTRTREATGNASGMQISADEGALLTLLVQLTGARNAVEVGVFTGYSSICIARGLPADGTLLACDVSEEWTSIAREYWERAGVDGRIELRIGPAADTLRALPAEPAFDIAFIDADKGGYPVYYEEVLQRLRPGGLIVLDNVLLGGRVLDPAYREEHHLAVRGLNDRIAADDRVDAVMLPVRDGVTLARKR